MNYIFVGGPGRSGTSFVADRIGSLERVATFKDIELKLLYELGGLYDLRQILAESYTPNRAIVGIGRLDAMFKSLRNGGYGQPRLGANNIDQAIGNAFEKFLQRIQPNGFPVPMTKAVFNTVARELLARLAKIAAIKSPDATHFLEKTPHNLLRPKFLHELALGARYIHVSRDPRAIATSLLFQRWGPNTLEHAILWVKSYLSSWESALEIFSRFDMPLMCLQIEDVSRNTEKSSEETLDFLGLDKTGEDIFQGANIDILDGWKSKVDDQKKDLLNKSFLGDVR